MEVINGSKTDFCLNESKRAHGYLNSLVEPIVTKSIKVTLENSKPVQSSSHKRSNDLLNGMLLLFILTTMTIALPFLRFFLLDAFVCNLWMQTLIHGYDQCDNKRCSKGSHWYGNSLDIVNQILSGLTSNIRHIYHLLTKNYDESLSLKSIKDWYQKLSDNFPKNLTFMGLSFLSLSSVLGLSAYQISVPIASTLSPLLAKNIDLSSFEKEARLLFSKVSNPFKGDKSSVPKI